MNIYLLFTILLFFLAVSDLIVGVSNDAVNFLNSAIGSSVASLKVILTVAGLGVLIGATFSSGMMEIARSGIFHPDQFYFSEIMLIFLAVMITDIILLDTFNTFGFPTSTTVSIVFELLGAAVAISLIKISHSPDGLNDLGNYINSSKALAIISGILLSVVIAFTCGTVIQFITRLIFSFNYERYMKYFGAIWGSIAITAIVYFILVKGAKGASFMTTETVNWIHTHTMHILLYFFTGCAILLQFLISLFRVNILKIIVLVGTFSLAMAFAGNDLVNFIGVPLAGFESFKEFMSDPTFNPNTHTMDALLQPIKTPTLFLLAAGVVMVVTLFMSKKARTVTKTEIHLASQDTQVERFASSGFSRSVVRGTVGITKLFKKAIPEGLINFIQKRFDYNYYTKKPKKRKGQSSFDELRASVNIFVASILIASATSLKLPLSTTYVTFMVAMGTSLADRAWGRESAVYRITGVISVIGGWFFTGLTAFTGAFLLALFLNWGGIIAIFISLIVAILFVIRTYFVHKKRIGKHDKKDAFDDKEILNGMNILERCNSSILNIINSASLLYFSSLLNLIREDRKKMKKVKKSVEELNLEAKELKYKLYPTLQKLEEDSIETGHYYVQILDYIREIAHCLTYISEPIFEYVNNIHPPITKEQIKDMHELNELISAFYSEIQNIIRKQSYKHLDTLIEHQQSILDFIAKINKKQVKLIKSGLVGTRNSIMYMNLLSESKNLVLHTVNMVKSHRDFLINSNKGKATNK